MRMRKKKHLNERLAACGNWIDTPTVAADFREEIQKKEYLDLDALFGKEQPLYLEIGCGKGQFVCEAAKRHPEINFLAVEVNKNVLALATEKAKAMELQNVVFLRCGAEVLQKYLRPNSVSRIYLNFSCPYPKTTYANRRLTNPKFLAIYRDLLAPGGEIHQKTDNMHFFEYSIEQYARCGCGLKAVSLNLHESGFEGNIVTEYEEKFSSQGYPIYRLEAWFPENGQG